MNLTWNDIDLLTESIYLETKDKDYDVIVGVSRGGLVPSTILSHKLGLPLQTVNWQTRDGDNREVGSLFKLAVKYQNMLIVDDICDSGVTIRDMTELCKDRADFAVLVNKQPDSGLVSYQGTEYQGNEWVVFPWETINEKV